MRKRILVLMVLATMLVGCGEPKFYNKQNITDWQAFNATHDDYHVIFAKNKIACFSDGSYGANELFKKFVSKFGR